MEFQTLSNLSDLRIAISINCTVYQLNMYRIRVFSSNLQVVQRFDSSKRMEFQTLSNLSDLRIAISINCTVYQLNIRKYKYKLFEIAKIFHQLIVLITKIFAR